MAMYKSSNKRNGNGMWGTRRMGGILYSEECCWQTFWEMSPSIPRNVSKPSRECPQTFRETLLNIPGNVGKHSGEFR